MNAAAQLVVASHDPTDALRAFFQNAPVGWALCDRHGNVRRVNPELETMLDGNLKMVRPLSLANLIQPQDYAHCQRLLSELFERKCSNFQIEGRPLSANQKVLRWTVWRVPAIDASLEQLGAIAEEIPEHFEIEQRLRQAQRLEAVGRLAGGVAHDFNNLLTGVLLYCDLLMASLEPGDRARKYGEEIRNAGLQATGLVRQLLAVARPRSSEPRPLSLNEITEGMRNLLVRLIGENIDLEFHLDPDLGLIRMDPTKAQQILLNLVLNARDAMPGGGNITVETRNCQVQVLAEAGSGAESGTSLPCALFVVRDNGSGMDEATRAHLFDMFFTTKAGGKGNGLGLATVHEIVTGSGGLIHVDSAPARGTRVTVLLPLVPADVLELKSAGDFANANNLEMCALKEEEEE